MRFNRDDEILSKKKTSSLLEVCRFSFSESWTCFIHFGRVCTGGDQNKVDILKSDPGRDSERNVVLSFRTNYTTSSFLFYTLVFSRSETKNEPRRVASVRAARRCLLFRTYLFHHHTRLWALHVLHLNKRQALRGRKVDFNDACWCRIASVIRFSIGVIGGYIPHSAKRCFLFSTPFMFVIREVKDPKIRLRIGIRGKHWMDKETVGIKITLILITFDRLERFSSKTLTMEWSLGVI